MFFMIETYLSSNHTSEIVDLGLGEHAVEISRLDEKHQLKWRDFQKKMQESGEFWCCAEFTDFTRQNKETLENARQVYNELAKLECKPSLKILLDGCNRLLASCEEKVTILNAFQAVAYQYNPKSKGSDLPQKINELLEHLKSIDEKDSHIIKKGIELFAERERMCRAMKTDGILFENLDEESTHFHSCMQLLLGSQARYQVWQPFMANFATVLCDLEEGKEAKDLQVMVEQAEKLGVWNMTRQLMDEAKNRKL